jgi:hypothetical protein
MSRIWAFVLPCLVSLAAPCKDMHPLQGVWQVKTTEGDCTCTDSEAGGTHTYIWHVHPQEDGKVDITVQGETSFPRLQGKWDPVTGVLIINGYYTNENDACWFKLTIEKDGSLIGVRRYISGTQSRDNRPCFIEFSVTAKRTSTYLG